MRFFEKVRPLYTKREREYLIPIFEEVYANAKKVVPYLDNIEICIIDKMTVNACAIGRNTIAVTKGAIEIFSEEELKGILAHELAHIINGDTIATLLTLIGNGFFTVFVVITKLILLVVDFFQNPRGFGKLITILTNAVCIAFIFLFTFIGNIIVSINSRKNEYRADEFAYILSYGEDMVEALYLLQKISMGDNSSTVERITASHPHIAKRIGTLENLIDNNCSKNINIYRGSHNLL